MSLEKGIGRIGKVCGIIFGSLAALTSFVYVYSEINNYNLWVVDKFSLESMIIWALLAGVAGFFVTYYVIKGITKTINWIIAGFKE